MNRREEWQLIYKLTPEQQSQGFRIGGISCPTLYDKNFNGWNLEMISVEEAIKASKTLINCRDCFGCEKCENCIDCSWCKNCKDCVNCSNCEKCNNCEFCTSSKNLTNTSNYLENKPNKM